MQVTIEPATIRHLRQLLNIERECFTVEAYTEKQVLDLLRNPRAVALLARVDCDFAGFIIGLVEDLKNVKLGHIVTIDVALSHRRKGIGLMLLKKAEVIFLQKGVKSIHLEVRADNKSARRLYRKQGYRQMGSLEDYYSAGAHGLRLVKQLMRSSDSFCQP